MMERLFDPHHSPFFSSIAPLAQLGAKCLAQGGARERAPLIHYAVQG